MLAVIVVCPKKVQGHLSCLTEHEGWLETSLTRHNLALRCQHVGPEQVYGLPVQIQFWICQKSFHTFAHCLKESLALLNCSFKKCLKLIASLLFVVCMNLPFPKMSSVFCIPLILIVIVVSQRTLEYWFIFFFVLFVIFFFQQCF